MERDVMPGDFVKVKPTHVADLNGDPAVGTVVRVWPTTGKVRILWQNHGCRTHDIRSPYLDRFTAKLLRKSDRKGESKIMENIFDEVDLNVIYDTLGHKIRTTPWNVDDPDQFQELVALKALQTRIADQLNGGK